MTNRENLDIKAILEASAKGMFEAKRGAGSWERIHVADRNEFTSTLMQPIWHALPEIIAQVEAKVAEEKADILASFTVPDTLEGIEGLGGLTA